jgi:hypothetical protein
MAPNTMLNSEDGEGGRAKPDPEPSGCRGLLLHQPLPVAQEFGATLQRDEQAAATTRLRLLTVDLANRSAGDLVAGQDEIDFVDFPVDGFHVHHFGSFVAAEFFLFVKVYWSQRNIFAIERDVKLLVFRRRQLLVEITFHSLWVSGLGRCRGTPWLPSI